jgi:tRNA A-37 threonylcarbamoyl transferase component Bud32
VAEPNESKLLSVAASISDGAGVDWERLEQKPVDAHETQVLRELRVLDQIATFHRSPEPPSYGSGQGDREPAEGSPLAIDPSSHAAGELEPGGDVADEGLQTWGHLAVLEKIGEGAFGAVYRARDDKLQREVALKLLWPAEPDARSNSSRALKEARLLARVRHPNVATVYGADQLHGRVGLWMEFVRGRTLAELLRAHGPFSAREAALVGLDLCRALAAVHGAGLLHGDVKAHNVMREEGGRTVLMDFGTGKDLSQDRAPRHQGAADDFAGTPLYLAPEVFEGHARTKATDIYSLGVLLYHLVTGSYPVEGRTREEVERAHRLQERRHLRDVRPDLPEEFVHTVQRALDPDPRQRYQGAGAFESALARFLGATAEVERGWLSFGVRRTTIVACALGVMLTMGAAYWVAGRSPRRAGGDPSAARAELASSLPQSASAQATAPSYTIDTALYRQLRGQEVRLRPGARIEPGAKLFAKVRASVPTFVYIVNEDEHGDVYLLFPLPGQSLKNPLPAGTANRLPGAQDSQDNKEILWQVDKAGGREHFLIFASPERMSVFEQMFAKLPHPEAGRPIQSAPLSRASVGMLRSVGGLAPAVDSGRPSNGPLTEQFSTPLGDTEETARGMWIRQLTLDNPER